MSEDKAPEYLNDFTGGDKPTVPHEAGREARLKAAGVAQGESLQDAWRRRADEALRKEQPGAVEYKQEPETTKSVVGYSPEKKAALKLMESEKITIAEALERVRSEARSEAKKEKASRTSGKGK